MKYLLIILLTLFIATTIGSIVIKDTGYVLLSISGWKIETSVVLFFIILFIIFSLLYFLIRSLVRAWQLPEQIRTWKVNRNHISRKKILWIASYPKSGNTWMRAIISSLFFSNNGKFSFE